MMGEVSTALMAKIGDNLLPTLADEIRIHHQASEISRKESVDHAIEAGKLLKQAKDLVVRQGGSWLVWVRANCNFGERTAQIYMKMAKAEYETAVSHLSLRDAVKATANSKPQDKPKPRSPEHAAALSEATKGRIKAKRRNPKSPKLKQNFIPNVPGYLEEMLLSMERCVIEYELPPVEAAAKGIIAHRLKVEHFDEIIGWLARLKEQVHAGATAQKEATQ